MDALGQQVGFQTLEIKGEHEDSAFFCLVHNIEGKIWKQKHANNK